MKTKLTLALMLVVAVLGASRADAQASAANYGFSTTQTGSLTDMSSGTTTLIGPNQDDSTSTVNLIGFDFILMGTRHSRFSVNSNGTMRLGTTLVGSTLYNPLGQSSQPLITAYGADQRTHTSGKVHHKVTGSAPNRVLVVEWLNMQSDFNSGGTADLTYQVRLSEAAGTIEFVYGSMTLSPAASADANSNSPQYGFSTNNSANTNGTITAAQSGTPAPTYASAAAPVNNLYVAGTISVLSSAANGSRRTFLLTPPVAVPPGGPLTFTGVTATSMTLNWTDSTNEVGYEIFNSTDGVNFNLFASVPAGLTSYVANGLVGSTTYTWRVHALTEGTDAFISGTQATAAPTAVSSLGTGLWSDPANWSTGSVPAGNDAVTIASSHIVTIDASSSAYSVTVASGAVLQFEQTTARALAVGRDVVVQSGGTLQSNPAGTQIGHVLGVGASLTNNGTLDFSTNADTAGAGITFTGTENATFSGSGATTDIRSITVNKGTSAVPTVQITPANFTVRGVTTDAVVGGWLALTNGTLRLSGTFSGTSRVFSAAAYTIGATAGFWLDNPNYVVAAQNGNAVINGSLRVTQGTFNQGTTNAATMTAGAGAVVTIESTAVVNLSGRFNPANAITYNQSGGTLNVAVVGNSGSGAANASFRLVAGATFNMTGGTINLVQASTGATPVDYSNLAGTVVASTGTLQAGTGATVTNFNFRITGNVPNLVIDNTTSNKTATVIGTTLTAGNTLVKSGTTLVLNGQLYAHSGPTFTNNGTINGTATGSRFYFLGTGSATTYTGSGVVVTPLSSFDVDNEDGVTIDPSANPFVTLRFNNFAGGLVNSNKLTIGNGGTTSAVVQLGVSGVTSPVTGFDVPPTFNPGTGGVILIYAPELTTRTMGFEVPPSRTLSRLIVSNPSDVIMAGGDVTVTGNADTLVLGDEAALTTARLITGPHTLILSTPGATVDSPVLGYVIGNFRKTAAAAGVVPFELGTANGSTPVSFNVTSGTFPATITAAAVQGPAPGIQPTSKAINRHWNFSAAGITSDITVTYLDPADIPGTVTEADLHFFRKESGNASDFSDQGGTTNTAANTATITGVSSFSIWTLAEPGADLSITKTDGVTSVTPGGTVTYTITASNNGPGANPAAVVTDTFPAELTCSTTCIGAGGSSCTAGPFAGNINDTANITSGGSVTYTSVCAVSPTLAGSLVNTATVSGGAITDDVPGNNSATDTDAVDASADLFITKTDGVTTATAGGSVTYTISASNAGPSSAPGATVADTFPASLTCTWTCVGSGGGTCTAAGSGNINDTVNLPAGGGVTYTASCTISGAASGMLTNTATVTAPGSVTDPNPGNNSATDSDTLGASADLFITKTDGVTTATAGGSVTYTITASNAGPSSAPGATVADTFPASLTCTWACAGFGGGACTASGSGNINDTVNLPSGGSVEYTASCTISGAASGTLTNTATVTAPGSVTDPNPGNNSATDSDTLGASADLSITKTDGVTSVTAGGTTTYTITASNAGPSGAPGATVADTFPASLTCTWACAGFGGGTCTAAGSGNINDTVNLPSGGSVVYTASCTISGAASGTLTNTATVAAPAGVTDPNPGNNAATDVDALGAEADLSITKTDGVTSVTAGGTTTYTITASNAGPSNATGATVADTFPASLTCTWACAGFGGGTCTAAGSGNINDTVNLPSAGGVTYTANCTISGAASGTLTNTATVTAPGSVTDPNPGNNSATDSDAIGAEADLSITKTDGVTSVTAGGSTTYTITASNAGPSAVAGATVADTFPASLTCTWTCSALGGGSCTAAGSGNINDSVNLPTGASVTYTANCSVSGAASGTVSNTATISSPGGVTDPVPGNNSATDSDTISTPTGAAVSGTKTVTGNFVVGGNITYTIVLTNSGSGAQGDNPGNELLDVLPPQVALVSASASSGTAVATTGTNTVTWNGPIPAGGSVTITINATILPTAVGTTVANQGTISFDSDGNGTNDATAQTDDPNSAAGGDATDFAIAAAAGVAIPALSPLGLLMLSLMMAALAFAVLRRS